MTDVAEKAYNAGSFMTHAVCIGKQRRNRREHDPTPQRKRWVQAAGVPVISGVIYATETRIVPGFTAYTPPRVDL